MICVNAVANVFANPRLGTALTHVIDVATIPQGDIELPTARPSHKNNVPQAPTWDQFFVSIAGRESTRPRAGVPSLPKARIKDTKERNPQDVRAHAKCPPQPSTTMERDSQGPGRRG
jgi:hypothetical protein